MNDKNSLLSSPQLDDHEQQNALALTPRQLHSLYRKSKLFEIPLDVLETVYLRGFEAVSTNKEQSGFGRVESFIQGGKAAELDKDLKETTQGEPQSDNPAEPSSRFVGTDKLTTIFKNATPGQESRVDVVKRVVRDQINKNKKDPE